MSQIQMSPLGRFEKFLVPTDGSEFSRGAERVAIEMSRHSGAQLLAIRVLLKGSSFGYLRQRPTRSWRRRRRSNYPTSSAKPKPRACAASLR